MSVFAALLYPPRCVSCKKLLPWREAICNASQALCTCCRAKWDAAADVRCGVCGMPVYACECLTEQMQKAHIGAHRKLFYYEPNREDCPQSRILYAMKRNANARTEVFLAHEVIRRHGEALFSLDSPVLRYIPRRRNAKRQYGTDQAQRIAAVLSNVSGIPLVKALRRAGGKSLPQKTLSSEGRIAAVKKSFCLTAKAKSVLGKTVILVDDTVTTGASMAACARLLRRAGAINIIALSVASDTFNARLCFPKPQKK